MQTVPTRRDLIRQLPAHSIGVEVGCWRGYFATEILNHCPNVDKLYCVDAWAGQTGIYLGRDKTVEEHEADYAEARHHLRGFLSSGRVEIIRERSIKAAHEAGLPPLDFVYVDGDHSLEGCLADLIVWSRKLKPKGVLLGHDYKTDGNAGEWKFGVVPAVKFFCEEFGWEIEKLTAEDFASFQLRRK